MPTRQSHFIYENDRAENGILIRIGMAQPIIDFTGNLVEDGDYENTYEEGGKTYFKDILRFCVYVETDYDTDRDGMNDLVQALTARKVLRPAEV